MFYVIAPLLVLVALLQATIVPDIPGLGIRPDLVLLLVLAWTMARGTREGAVGAFVGGLALDIFSALPLGSHALLLLLTVIPVGWLGTPFYRGNPLYPIGGAFLATLFYNALLLALSAFLGQKVLWASMFWRMALPMALFEAALISLVYWILDRLDRRLYRRLTIA